MRGEAYHGTSKRFWKTAISKSRHDWAERVVVMAIFAAPSAENYKLVCEALPAAAAPKAENWYPLFGWPMVTPAAPVPERRAVVAVPTRTRPVAVAASANNAGRKRKIDELFAKARQHTMYDQEMASVSDFVKGIASPAARLRGCFLGLGLASTENLSYQTTLVPDQTTLVPDQRTLVPDQRVKSKCRACEMFRPHARDSDVAL